jgi:hypothetical protein
LEVEVAKYSGALPSIGHSRPGFARCANVARSTAALPLISVARLFHKGNRSQTARIARANCLERFVKISCSAYLETQYNDKTKRPDRSGRFAVSAMRLLLGAFFEGFQGIERRIDHELVGHHARYAAAGLGVHLIGHFD